MKSKKLIIGIIVIAVRGGRSICRADLAADVRKAG